MTTGPLAHVYLKDAFLYYDEKRMYLEGRKPLTLSRVDRAILGCIERADSELGVLSHALARDSGGTPAQIAAALVEDLGGPESVLEIGEPLDVIDPDVIVCSFAPDSGALDPRPIVRRLRRRLRVLHVGLAHYVDGPAASNPAFETLRAAGRFRSPFHFVQWARSFVRHRTRAVLVLTSAQDLILFGDLTERCHSFVYLNSRWPPSTAIAALAADDGPFHESAGSVQAMFYALRMLALCDYSRLDLLGSSDLARLHQRALTGASAIAFSTADQLDALIRAGRAAETCRPYALVPEARASARPRDGSLAIVLDREHLGAAVDLVRALDTARIEAGIETCRLRVENSWLDFRFAPDGLVVSDRSSSEPAPRPSVAIVLTGLARHIETATALESEGVPVLYYPSEHAHVLLDGRDDPRIVHARTTAGWAAVLRGALDVDDALRKTAVDRGLARTAARDVVARIVELVQTARR